IDLEWDEIIPKDQLEKMKAEEEKKKEEEYLQSQIEQSQPRKRKANTDETREQRAAKKRARDLAAEAAAEGSGDDMESDTSRDPKRPLGEKEVRLLIGAYERFGSFAEKQDDIIRVARLIGRDVEVVRSTLQEIVDTAERLLAEEEDRVAKLERDTNKPVTKKDRKAVLFDYRGVKRNNAETLVERPKEMRMIRA
ncbi:hypothetical protein KC352_g46864, partial [Hortaea werneckii]